MPRRSVTAVRSTHALLAVTALALVACSDAPTGTGRARPVAGDLRLTTSPGTPSKTSVCKVGPVGNYTFTASSSPDVIKTDGWNGTLLVSDPFTVAAGTCVDVFQGAPPADLLYIKEINLPAGITLDHINVQVNGGDCATDPFFCPVTFTGTDNVHFDTWDIHSFTVTFYNKGGTTPPPTGQGCTPGYWKNHTERWPSTGYSTSQDFNTVFGVVGNPNAFNPSLTLLQAAKNGGGGLNALGRHAVAALLSSSVLPNYGLTTTQVIQDVHDAIVSKSYEATKNLLAQLNMQGCPLN